MTSLTQSLIILSIICALVMVVLSDLRDKAYITHVCPEGATGPEDPHCIEWGCDHYFMISDRGNNPHSYCGLFDPDDRFEEVEDNE